MLHSTDKETKAQSVSKLPKARISRIANIRAQVYPIENPRSGISYADSRGPQKFFSACSLKTKHPGPVLKATQKHGSACHRLLT